MLKNLLTTYDLQSAVKKCLTYKNRGICNPPILMSSVRFLDERLVRQKALRYGCDSFSRTPLSFVI